jgi:hypothetical protein
MCVYIEAVKERGRKRERESEREGKGREESERECKKKTRGTQNGKRDREIERVKRHSYVIQ